MPESSKPIPEVGYPIQIMKKNHEQTMEVLEDRHKNLTGALGYQLAPKTNPKQC